MLFKNSKYRLQKLMIATAMITLSVIAKADLVPTGNNPFYYKMGGGQEIAVPAYGGASSVPLHVEGDVGLGYNCGLFNPKLSITNSLNAIKNSFQNIEQSIVANATSAIAEFPMYALSRADPDLYNLLNNGLLGARRDLELSTKSCQVMQSQMAQGKNPYTDWATLSMGNDWKYRMSLANNSSLHRGANTSDDNNSDINLVNQQVAQDNGDNGIPWVHGANIGRNGAYAGGRDEPAIFVIHDISVAVYNVILQSGRNYDDETPPVRTDANAHLVDTWANPDAAASWIVNVVGDEKITTYAGGDKQSSPGVGLLANNQQLSTQYTQQLQSLVSGQTAPTIENLQAVSAPGVMINTAVIKAIQQKEPVTQAILINKLGQEAATAKLIDESLLARQILLEGSQIPAVYGNKAAQESIQRGLSRLDQAINNLVFNANVRKQFVSNTASQLLENTHAEQVGSSTVQPSSKPTMEMENGAIHLNSQQ
jgi:integrating conjugative element protein (TIGR03755 family)